MALAAVDDLASGRQWRPNMSFPIYGGTLRCGRDAHAVRRNLRATVASAARGVAPAIKEALEIVLTMAGMFAIVAASLALDVWIWVPRSGH
jgi:hypothetical protein